MAAAGTLTYTWSGTRTARRVVIAWTSDAAGNANPASADLLLSGTISEIVTDPSATAPTDNYDITLMDEYGTDALAGAGANRDTSNSERAAVTGGVVQGLYAPTITNAGDTKSGTLVIDIAT